MRWHMTTLQLHDMIKSSRSHSEIMRSIAPTVEDLTVAGVLVKNGDFYLHNGVIVAQDVFIQDSMKRPRRSISFTSWLCLACVLRVNRPELRQILADTLTKYPIGECNDKKQRD